MVATSLTLLIGIQADSIMKSGALLPDTTILRLIVNELTTRGWLTSADPSPYVLNYVAASMDSFENLARRQEGVDNFVNPSRNAASRYEYSDNPNASFILDGFPRTAVQAKSLSTLLPINLVVNIKTPATVILDRICNRWTHVASGRVYNTTFNAPKVPGKDDVTGEELIQRADDKPEVWKARLAKFEETSAPLLEHYRKMGVLWTVEGNTSDEITPKLFEEFNKRFGVTESQAI